jgi:hypothetical protein
LAARGIPYQPLAVLEDIGISNAATRQGSEAGIG